MKKLIYISIGIIIGILLSIWKINVDAYQTGKYKDEVVDGDFYVAGNAEIVGTISAGTVDVSNVKISVVNDTIETGEIDYLSFYMSVLGEGGSNDYLNTINGGEEGDVINIFPTDSNSNVTLTENGNIDLGDLPNCNLNAKGDKAELYKKDSIWELIACLN
jgi:ABC-type molybdate transport system substrate-binding protein